MAAFPQVSTVTNSRAFQTTPGLQIASRPLCDLKVGKAQSREWILQSRAEPGDTSDQLEDISLGSQR